ncbi:MAG: ComEA family DNA-binding protein [Faecousia sp.]
MKKHPFVLLLVLTGLFAAFTLGFFLGRNQNHETIQLSVLPTQAQHNDGTVSTLPPQDTLEDEVTFPIDLNAAGIRELTALPGIGETLAKRILDYREQNGAFSRPEELMNVEGIGSGRLEALLDYVTTGG